MNDKFEDNNFVYFTGSKPPKDGLPWELFNIAGGATPHGFISHFYWRVSKDRYYLEKIKKENEFNKLLNAVLIFSSYLNKDDDKYKIIIDRINQSVLEKNNPEAIPHLKMTLNEVFTTLRILKLSKEEKEKPIFDMARKIAQEIFDEYP